MTLSFPNPSRSFDETRNAVRFIGHDGMFEVRFFVDAEALAASEAAKGGTGTLEAKCLSAFDALVTSVHDAARKLYVSSRRSSYMLTAADFKS